MVDAKFADAAADGFHVAGQPKRQPIQAHLNAGTCLSITQATEPLGKDRRLA